MRFLGVGIVWDKDKNKSLCEFKNGFYDTEIQEEIDKLLGLGYQNTETTIEVIEESPIQEESPITEIIIGDKTKGKKKK